MSIKLNCLNNLNSHLIDFGEIILICNFSIRFYTFFSRTNNLVKFGDTIIVLPAIFIQSVVNCKDQTPGFYKVSSASQYII